MLTKYTQKNISFTLAYFLFSIPIIAYCAFLQGCACSQQGTMPKYNVCVTKLPEKNKKDLLNLRYALANDREENAKVDQIINTIRKPDRLIAFIEKRVENEKNYQKVFKLLAKSERNLLKIKVYKAVFIEPLKKDSNPLDMEIKVMDLLYEQDRIIEEYAAPLRLIDTLDIGNQQSYIDMIEVLPDDEAIALKNSIIACSNSFQVSQLILSKLPKPLKNLTNDERANLSKLPDQDRQAILRAAMQKDHLPNKLKVNSHGQGGIDDHKRPADHRNSISPVEQTNYKPDKPLTDTNVSQSTLTNNGETTPKASLDINQLIQQKIEAHKNKPEPTPEDQDEWGPKLPLKDENRQKFLMYMVAFSPENGKSLKELFDQTPPKYIKNFFTVFFKDFNESERNELLKNLIYMKNNSPEVAINLCQKTLTWYQKIYLYRNKNNISINLLEKLEKTIEALPPSNETNIS